MKINTFDDYVANLREVYKLCMEIAKQYRDDVREDDYFIVCSNDEGLFVRFGRDGAYRVTVCITCKGTVDYYQLDEASYYDVANREYYSPYINLDSTNQK